MTRTTPAREGRLNPDTAIVEAALDAHPLPDDVHRAVWEALHLDGRCVHQIAAMTARAFPAFADALRGRAAGRRGERFGGHGHA